MKNTQESEINKARSKEPLRLLTLSDGLFATVLTLLVLDLRIPEAISSAGASISSFVAWTAPHLFSYALTFVVVGSYWSGHHRNFRYIKQDDQRLAAYNLAFLFFIGLLPFSTATVSLKSSSVDYFSFSWMIYSFNMILAGIMLDLTWRYALAHDLVSSELSHGQIRSFSIHHYIVPGTFLISILVEYLSSPRAWGPYTLMIIPLAMWFADRYFGTISQKRHGHTKSYEIWWKIGAVFPWLLVFFLAILGTILYQ